MPCSQPMKWSDAHDLFFLKELIQVQPWQHKKGTTERGEAWSKLAIVLGQCANPVFRVTLRSIRDRYMLLERRYKKKISEEEKASGISPDPSEIDKLIEEIVALFDEADKAEIAKKHKMEEEANQIQEMRKTSLETFRESRERNKDGKQNAKKKRTSGSDSIAFLRDKVEMESEHKMKEMELKKQQMEMEKELRESEMKLRMQEREERAQQQQTSARLQDQQLQQLQNMNMALLHQQQQQTQALMTLLQKFSDK